MSLTPHEIVERIQKRGSAESLQEKRESFAYLTSFSSVPSSAVAVRFTDRTFQARDGQIIHARVYGADRKKLVFFFHGGGFVSGSLYTHHAALMNLAEGCDATIIHIGYRLAPEFKYPCALHDAIDGFRFFTSEMKPKQVFVCGDSAGGNLAAALSMTLPHLISAQILLYPTLDSTFSAPSWRELRENPIANPKVSGELNHLYAKSMHDESEALFSPLLAHDFSKLPKCFALAGSEDAAKGDAESYVRKLQDAGVEAMYREYPRMIHGFFNMTDVLEGARQLHDDIRSVIRSL